MTQKQKALWVLRASCLATILVGLFGVALGFVWGETIPMLGVQVPLWVLGVTISYMGVRYLRRLPELDGSIGRDSRFAWANVAKLVRRGN
ncbi:MAG: hypothetical protein KIS92_18895 [Planctomycetota bacterium]|nr:hypothetical protein [Planctomycetota bacterium]